MSIILGLLMTILVLDCLLLIFLVLLQLPKKEAGAGIAFGAAATDALFGAGSGNVLTKITKWVAVIFFGVALLMGILTGNRSSGSGNALKKALGERPMSTSPAPVTPTLAPPPSSASSNTPLLELTNAAPAPAAKSATTNK